MLQPAAVDVVFPSFDRAPLAGSLSEPAGAAQGAVVIGSATGVPRAYYDGFAEYLAEGGLAALRFDYRGIGGSLRGALRDCDATMHSWGEHDLAGAVAFLRQRYRGPLLLVGHSVGGQLLGLLPQPGDVAAALTVAAQSGYWKLWSGIGRFRMFLLWKFAIPAAVRASGCFPLRRFTGSGLDLPPEVAREWARWGLDPEHVYGYARRKDGARGFSAWTGKLRAYAIADDAYAPRAAVEKLASCFSSAQREIRVVEPRSIGARRAGHFGFFQRRFRDTLWREAREWLLARAVELRARRAV